MTLSVPVLYPFNKNRKFGVLFRSIPFTVISNLVRNFACTRTFSPSNSKLGLMEGTDQGANIPLRVKDTCPKKNMLLLAINASKRPEGLTIFYILV